MSVPVAAGDDPRWRLATSIEPDDPGHRAIPPEVWRAVVRDATHRRIAAPAAPGRLALPDRTIAARSHGGKMSGGPRLGVIHSAETPLQAGYAYSIAANWFATTATTSATVMIDPAETIRLLPDDTVSYAVGPAANGFTVNVEQAGRASMTRAEWLSPGAGIPQMRNVAEYMRECRDRWALPLRWASDADIRRAATDPSFHAGWCTHDDIRRVLGGTTHTDPGRNYPRTELMTLANTGGNTMATLDADDLENIKRAAYEGVWGLPGVNAKGVALIPRELEGGGEFPFTTIGSLTARVDRIVARHIAAIADPAKLAEALAPSLGAVLAEALPDGGTVDQAAIEAALRNVLREGVA